MHYTNNMIYILRKIKTKKQNIMQMNLERKKTEISIQ